METVKTVAQSTRSGLLAGSTALLVLGAISFTGNAHARNSASFSVGTGVPNVSIGVSNNVYPVYSEPLYAQPVYLQPVYVQPRPVYVHLSPYTCSQYRFIIKVRRFITRTRRAMGITAGATMCRHLVLVTGLVFQVSAVRRFITSAKHQNLNCALC